MNIEVIAAELDPVEEVAELIPGPQGATGQPGADGGDGPPGADAELPASASQAEAEDGTGAALRMWSALRIWQAITAFVTKFVRPVVNLGTCAAAVSLDMGNKAVYRAKGTLDVAGTVPETTFTYSNIPAGDTAIVLSLAAGADPGNVVFTDDTTAGTLTPNSATITADKSYIIRIWPKHLVTGAWVQIAEMG